MNWKNFFRGLAGPACLAALLAFSGCTLIPTLKGASATRETKTIAQGAQANLSEAFAGLSQEEAAFLQKIIGLLSSGRLTELLSLVDQNYRSVGRSESFSVLQSNILRLVSATYTFILNRIYDVSKQESTDAEGNRVTQFKFSIDAFLIIPLGLQFQLRFPVTLLAKKINNQWVIVGIQDLIANLFYFGGVFSDPVNPSLLTLTTTAGTARVDTNTGTPPPPATPGAA